jgi:hypothetical protein
VMGVAVVAVAVAVVHRRPLFACGCSSAAPDLPLIITACQCQSLPAHLPLPTD